MTDLGLVVSPTHILTVEQHHELKPGSLASILYDVRDIDRLLALAAGAPVVVSLNNECAQVGSNWSGFRAACESIALQYGSHANLTVCAGHELDLFWADNPLDCPPAFGASLVITALKAFKGTKVTVSVSPVAGPKWVDWLTQTIKLLRDVGSMPDAIAGDFYGQTPDRWTGWGFGELDDCILKAREIADGLPIHLREFGIKLIDADLDPDPDTIAELEAHQAEHLTLTAETLLEYSTDEVASAAWFSYHENMGKPDERGMNAFGLLRADGSERPSYTAFAQRPRPEVLTMPTRAELVSYARAAAELHGWSGEIFVKQITQESDFNPKASNPSGASGIAQIIPRFHPGVDVWDPFDSLDYAASWMKKLLDTYGGSYPKALSAYNWGPGNVNTWNGKRESLPDETEHYLDVILGTAWDAAIQGPTIVFNPNEPVHPQEESFDCSQESLEWVLWAYGRTTSDDWLEQAMLGGTDGGPIVMSKSLGLLDATGDGLVAFVAYHYSELGYRASNQNVVTFDDVCNEMISGKAPYGILLGGRAWGHWTAVRGYDKDRDRLLLANPSDGFKGVSQNMDRAQFVMLGSFSMVRVIHESYTPVVVEPQPSEVDQLKAKIVRLSTLVGEAYNEDGSVVRGLRSLSDRAHDLADDIDNIIYFLEKNRLGGAA